MGLATGRALERRGHDAVVYEQFEAGHTRGSSHGRSRIFRLAYGEEEYVRLAQESLGLWRELESESGKVIATLRIRNRRSESAREGTLRRSPARSLAREPPSGR